MFLGPLTTARFLLRICRQPPFGKLAPIVEVDLCCSIGWIILASTVVGAVAAQQPCGIYRIGLLGTGESWEERGDRGPEGRGARGWVRAAVGVAGAAMGEKWE